MRIPNLLMKRSASSGGFSKLDLRQGYHQPTLDEETRKIQKQHSARYGETTDPEG